MGIPASSLQINKQQTAANPTQLAFNKLVQQLEKARQKLEKTKQLLDEKKSYTNTHLLPEVVREYKLKVRIIEQFYEECISTKAKKRKELLARFILNEVQLMYLFPMGLPERAGERLEEIADACEKIAYPETDDDEFADLDQFIFDEMIAEVKERCAEMGVEIDLSELTPEMSPQEVQSRIHRLLEEADAPEEKKSRPKKKSKKELEREQKQLQKEGARKKSIGSIYKSLAKLMHPDLEKDPEERLKKEEIMKELTLAYKANDLYTLLHLEQEWMSSNRERLNEMNDDQLKIYLELLREQVQELQQQEAILVHHQDYMFMTTLAGGPFYLMRWKPEHQKRIIEARIVSLDLDLMKLTGSKAGRTAFIKAELDRFKEQEEEDDFGMLQFMEL